MLVSSLYRITELLSRIKYGIRGIIYGTTFSVVGQFPPPQEKMPDFFRTKLICVGSGTGLGLGLGLYLVSKVVFWAFFEIFLLITLEPQYAFTARMDYYLA